MDAEANVLSPEDLIKEFKNKYADKDFNISDNGEFCIVKNNKLRPIANFSLIPVGTTTAEDDSKNVMFVFNAMIFDGRKKLVLPKIKVQYKDLATKKWLRNEIPLGMFNMNETKGYELLKIFILRSLSKDMVEIINVERSGWHCFENDWVYIHSGGTIGTTNKNVQLADKDFMLKIDKDIATKEAFLESLKMLDMLEPKLTHALFSLVLVSIITSPLIENGLAPQFSIWVEGRSGMGKTSLTKMFTQIFENPKLVHVYDFKKDINKTVMNRDCVSIIDDYGVAKTKRTVDLTNEKIEKLIRDIGDRDLAANFTLRPEGMVLFTGEKFITMSNADITSTAGRVVRVQMDNLFDKKQVATFDPLKVERFNYYEKTPFLSTSIADYLKWISEKLNSHFIDSYRRDFDYNRNYYSMITDAHSRQKDSFAHLTVAFNFYLAYGLENGFITPEESAFYRERARGLFEELLLEQVVSPYDTNVEVFLNALEELILEERIIVKVKGISFMQQGDVLGIVDMSDKTMSLTWQPVYELVVNHIQINDDRSEFISDIKLGKLFREANLIYRSNGRVTKPVSGLDGRAIQFNTDKFPKLVEAIIEINKNRTFNSLLEDYALDAQENERRKQENREYKENQKELKEFKKTIFQTGRGIDELSELD
ncbi:hypothetical protein A7K91_03340 [Paenibacillus oryzae]|uniref:DUF927 domain-containing protein n=1 Tax=Paenibacillus oryzae TaxID=1844972 RepID=A0A1A5YLJ4_9BACL|nr:hypothetical protein [Paenibacillus oryzae]OBR66492.1 hypothetical protein A7K91_03340 [Paenibacillus oryzae]